MSEDLIKRLRNVTEGDAYALPWTFGETCREAADALEARKRENEALREAADRKDEALREARQRLSYDAELFHDQGCCDRESACLDAMRRIEAALSGHTEKGGE